MQLHIANATKQDHDFQYLTPGIRQPRLLPVRRGSQVVITGQKDELENIVSQHRRYGIVDVKEFSRESKFAGLVFSFDGPINVDAIYHALEHHDEVIDGVAQTVRENSTAATNAAIEQHAEGSNSEVNSTSFELKELPKDQADTSKKVDVMVKADKKADPAVKRSSRRPQGH